MTPAPRSPRRTPTLLPLLAIWVLAPLLLATIGLARFERSYQTRIYPGVQGMGVDLSGMTWEQAVAALTAATQAYDLPPLAIRHGDQVWPLRADELGMQVNVDELATRAYAVGRRGDLFSNLTAQTRAFWWGLREEPTMSVQPGAVTAAIAERTAALNRPVTQPKLSLSDLQVVASASRPGQYVDVEATRSQVLDRIASGRGGVVDVVVRPLAASTANVAEEQQAIEQLLGQSIVLADASGEFQFALDPATLAGLMAWSDDSTAAGGLRPEVQIDKVQALVDSWAQQVARPPLNARFDYDARSGSLLELSPSIEGRALDVEATVTAVVDAIANKTPYVALPVNALRPAVASEDAPNFGIKELVAEGTSTFAGSSRDRVRNVEVAASKLVGVVVPPDGVFSFNEFVGDVTAANGFEDSLVIAGDTTAVGVGGGVCQVSTTVFRAAWFGGLPIEERWNHGYVVSWYGEPGLDATVYTPTVDFKFRNTTGHHLLVKPILDSENGTLTVQFWGTKPGWKVEAFDPQYSNRQNPPAPLYVEDASLTPGKVVQFDWSVAGLDAAVRRRVIGSDGEVLIDQTLKSRYQPWQAKYRYGPGYTPPAGAEVARAQ